MAGQAAPAPPAAGLRGALILGSARCGSTLISEMLRLHPGVLSLSELFAMIGPRAFTAQSCDGRQFWDILSRPDPAMARIGNPQVAPREFLYGRIDNPAHDPFRCPPLLTIALPHLTDLPDALFDQLRPLMTARPRGPLAGHYLALFAALDRLLPGAGQRLVWAERSGGALAAAGTLRGMFPRAQAVLLWREGPETALSMRDYPATRLAIWMWRHGLGLLDPIHPRRHFGRGRIWPLISRAGGGLPLTRILAQRPSPAQCGQFWSALIRNGLTSLNPAETSVIRYETLITDPRAELVRLGQAVGAGAPDDWVSQCAALPRAQKSRAADLPRDQRHALLEACQGGDAAFQAFLAGQ